MKENRKSLKPSLLECGGSRKPLDVGVPSALMSLCSAPFVKPTVVFLLDQALHTKAERLVTHRGVPMECMTSAWL